MRLKLKSTNGVSTITLDDSKKLFKDFLIDIQQDTQLHQDTSESVSTIKLGSHLNQLTYHMD